MKKIISFLKTDVKIINSYFLFTIVLIILVGIGYSSYALFSFTKTSNNIIEGTVGDLSTIGTDTLIKLTDNKDNSGLYTITHAADNTLQIGETESVTEYRYRGANPKNYVTFNNEVWRIIGVFPTDDGTGNIENRIKIIRNESIGNKYWNTTQVSSTSSYNNWTEATLNTELNGTYLNGLSGEAQSMIGNAKYYLGGYDGRISSGQGFSQTSIDMYSYERKIKNTISNEFYYGTNPNSYNNKLGLIYVSDYGYASANCENKMLKRVSSSQEDLRTCVNTNWLYNIKVDEWTLSQVTSYYTVVFYATSNGYVNSNSVNYYQYAVRPTLYLKSNIKITGGDGTSSDPYTLGI